jgi:hypothetical protein
MDRRHLLLAGLAAPLAACVATPYGTYYRPASADPGARVRRAWCGGQAGPGSVLQVDAPLGLKLEATTDKPHARRGVPGVPLRVQIALPTAAPLRFGPGGPMLLDPASGRPIAAPIVARVGSRVQLASDAVVDAMALRPAGAAGRSRDALVPQGRASWTLQLPADFAPPSIALQLPAVVQQGQPLITPPVLLSRPGSARRPGDYRSEAEQQHLREREAACRRDTPQLACENIVPYSERSFLLRAGPLGWEGHWARFEGGSAPTPVRVTQSLVVADPGPWRLAEPVLHLSDPASGRRLALPLPQMHLSFDDTFDFDSPLLTQPVPLRETLSLSLEADLPEGLPAFELRMPPLQVGGQTVALAPLQFERRSFDGGIEPFNC